jgi:hypothetical protein
MEVADSSTTMFSAESMQCRCECAVLSVKLVLDSIDHLRMYLPAKYVLQLQLNISFLSKHSLASLYCRVAACIGDVDLS